MKTVSKCQLLFARHIVGTTKFFRLKQRLQFWCAIVLSLIVYSGAWADTYRAKAAYQYLAWTYSPYFNSPHEAAQEAYNNWAPNGYGKPIEKLDWGFTTCASKVWNEPPPNFSIEVWGLVETYRDSGEKYIACQNTLATVGRNLLCPYGGMVTTTYPGLCINAPACSTPGEVRDRETGICSADPRNYGAPTCQVGTPNPIHAGTGNKYWSDTDYQSAVLEGVSFVRYYNSQQSNTLSTLGAAWRHYYERVVITIAGNDGTFAVLARPNGTAYTFRATGNLYIPQDAGITDKLKRLVDSGGVTTGWEYSVAANDSIEVYDAAGKLSSIQSRNGSIQTLTYSDGSTPGAVAPYSGLLIRVTDSFGRQLNLAYDYRGRLVQLTAAGDGTYLYGYDAKGNLVSVTYPDGKIKGYQYNDAANTGGADLPHALTGLVDENAARYASYNYNPEGKAVGSEHAGGVDRYSVAYGTGSATITDPLGTSRTTGFTTVLGMIRAASQSQPGGSGCGPASSAMTYDANGNIASRTDFNGTQTTYGYDRTRNLETSRVEAAGSAQARTISTEWHATYRLPTRIAEPKRITTNTYGSSGNLLTRTVQATSDATGAQGFDAPLAGLPRIWSYTYNAVGQVLTATGPRTDVLDKTTYAYDTSGNLASITNGANQVTTLSKYDAHGRVGRIVDPNGLITDLTYSPRGWLTSRSVGGETTGYEYDGVGQLKKVTLPDGSLVNYTYDDAHRLTSIADSLGNRIAYTLDAMGNRIKEEVKDPNGTLARQTTRVYDALNRLQQITGGVQ